ncbi:MAG: PQQ-dependent dehydrogenase, methanol/ethanol family [Polyangiales bacterium]
MHVQTTWRRFQRAALTALLLQLGCARPVPVAAPKPEPELASVDDSRLQGAAADADNWLTHGRTYDEQRHSPLKQIDVSNVNTLGLAWAYDLDTDRGQEATPLVVDGVMYSTSAWSKVQALDAASGKLLWQYDPQVPGEVAVKACCDVVNRGVAIYKGRLFLGTLDGRLIALDAATGAEVWSAHTVDPQKPYTITGAPRVVKGKVVIGNGGAELGVRGYVTAYDADSGRPAWRFYTVPGDPSEPFEAPILERAAQTWSGQWWQSGGGGTVWDSMAYDPQLDLLYIGTGSGSPWNQRIRSDNRGDNLFLSSIIALRPDTGEYVWHYQTTPGDSWDYTATQHIVLADLTIEGQLRKVLLQAPKNGFFYVLDREKGTLLSAKAFATLNWASGVDLETGRPRINPDAQYGKTGKPWFAMPSPYGAHNWQPMSFSPDTGLVYIPTQDAPFAYVDEPGYKPKAIGLNAGIDGPSASLPHDTTVRAQLLASVRGFLKAWDPVAQKEVWRVEQLGAWNGGVLSTAGSLVFEGNAAGQFNAYHATTGATLWSFAAQGGIVAAPIAYAVAGQQYVAIVVGWGGRFPLSAGEMATKGGLTFNKSRILAFRLGGEGELPPPPEPAPLPQPPARFGDPNMLQTGMVMFHAYCNVCHGDTAVGGGVLPDVRHSGALSDPARWQRIVREGSLRHSGMPAFGSVLTPLAAEAARAYIIERAQDEYTRVAVTRLQPAEQRAVASEAGLAPDAAVPDPAAVEEPSSTDTSAKEASEQR